jgi:hypothetical protein
MAQYIDKDALVAEIRSRLHPVVVPHGTDYDDWDRGADSERLNILSFLDTLEVKEVDLDSDIRTYLTNHFNIYEDGVLQSKKSGLPLRTYDIIKEAEHFFELGMQGKENNK